jgi:hypothetical protein
MDGDMLAGLRPCAAATRTFEISTPSTRAKNFERRGTILPGPQAKSRAALSEVVSKMGNLTSQLRMSSIVSCGTLSFHCVFGTTVSGGRFLSPSYL